MNSTKAAGLNHYAIKPGETKKQIQEKAQQIFRIAVPKAAAAASGAATFSAAYLSHSLISDERMGILLLNIFYLFSLLVAVVAHKTTRDTYFSGKKDI